MKKVKVKYIYIQIDRQIDRQIDNDIIGLGMLNGSKHHLNKFGANQLTKNYGEVFKA